MRRAVPVLLLLALAAAAPAHPKAPHGKTVPAHGDPPAHSDAPARNGPPHAWLFGTWTGGLFPVLDTMLAQDCRTQPTVAFGQDAVGHATLLGSSMAQRVIETVRTSPSGAEFRFAPAEGDAAGFGCDDANVLHVARETGDEISFPHCAAFPYKLQRCSRR